MDNNSTDRNLSSQNQTQNVEQTESQPRKKRRALLWILLLLLLAVAIIGGYLYMQYKAAMSDEKVEPRYTDEQLGIDARVAEELSGYRCIAVYGVDDDKRSEVMVVVAVNKETRAGKVFTVYPDTYMQLNSDKAYSFNNEEKDLFMCGNAYSEGDLLTSIRMINRHLDLNIREAIGMDWDVVADIADEIGGVTLDADYAFDVYPDLASPNREGVIVKDGRVSFNGTQAVNYLRTRKGSMSVTKSEAEFNSHVFNSLFAKAKGMEKKDLVDLFKVSAGKCDTIMNLKQMLVLVKEVMSYQIMTEDSWPYDYNKMTDGSYSYRVPNTLESNVSQLHLKLFNQKDYKVTDTCNGLSSLIKENKKQLN